MSRWCSTNTTAIASGNITVHQWHEARYGDCSLIQRGKAAPAFAARSGDIISLFTMAFHTENDSYFDVGVVWVELESMMMMMVMGVSVVAREAFNPGSDRVRAVDPLSGVRVVHICYFYVSNLRLRFGNA